MEINTQFFLTVAGTALVVAILVEVLKRWLKRKAEAWWYDAAIITTAFLLAFAASAAAYYANREVIDGPVLAFLGLQGIVVGALATGGYEWVTKLWNFAGGVGNALREARTTITVGNIEDSSGIAIGEDSDSETTISNSG